LAWGLATFIAFQLILAGMVRFCFPFLRDPDYAYKADRLEHRLRATGGRPLTVVMLGSSRTVFGLKPKPLEGKLARDLGSPCIVFNFGLTGAGPLLEWLSLDRLLRDEIRPDVLLVEVLPALLADQSPGPPEGYNLPAERLWLADLSLLEPYGFPLPAYRRSWWASWTLPWYTLRFGILSRVTPTWLPWNVRKDWFRSIDEWGCPDRPLQANTPAVYRYAVDRAHREYLPFLSRFRLGAPSCQALRDLLARCRREGITAALVLMPEGTEFRSWYPPAAWAQIETCLAELSRIYGVPVINAREWVADDQFADSHHLRPEGADVFTARLEPEVAALLAQARPAQAAAHAPAPTGLPRGPAR
jgi:hypothetical protein